MYELKEESKRFKKLVARYNNDTWNRQQTNKVPIPELKKWRIDTFHIINNIYKYSENTRIWLNNEEDKNSFEGAAKLTTFGFRQARFQDNDVKGFATKAIGMPASLKHLEKPQDEDRVHNTFDQEFIANLQQARQQLIENGKSNVLDCKRSDIHPDDEDDNSQDNSDCSEDEGNQSEPESLIYAITGDAKRPNGRLAKIRYEIR
ncbi:hypothetical protein G6F49_000077 [Rhizopus delemar]|nr:hypothetical protein G6F36_012037 [Rhizopus arrhizus]KAG1547751.1 hypothetical protein G6F51_004079 [Rhizopus arrhizus]KAG1563398.1 hypothetical protein G6F49_000077 [Rhizopus delemar]